MLIAPLPCRVIDESDPTSAELAASPTSVKSGRHRSNHVETGPTIPVQIALKLGRIRAKLDPKQASIYPNPTDGRGACAGDMSFDPCHPCGLMEAHKGNRPEALMLTAHSGVVQEAADKKQMARRTRDGMSDAPPHAGPSGKAL